MEHPNKKYRDCRDLIGKMIDHEPGYEMKHEFYGSAFPSKKSHLFQFEIALAGDEYSKYGVDLLRTEESGMDVLAEELLDELLEELAMDSECD